jgi:hypothetical protein
MPHQSRIPAGLQHFAARAGTAHPPISSAQSAAVALSPACRCGRLCLRPHPCLPQCSSGRAAAAAWCAVAPPASRPPPAARCGAVAEAANRQRPPLPAHSATAGAVLLASPVASSRGWGADCAAARYEEGDAWREGKGSSGVGGGGGGERGGQRGPGQPHGHTTRRLGRPGERWLVCGEGESRGRGGERVGCGAAVLRVRRGGSGPGQRRAGPARGAPAAQGAGGQGW